MPNTNKIGQLIRTRREDLGLTQNDLGRLLGLKYGNFIGMLETGKAAFPMARVLDYAKALEVDPPDLLRVVFQEMFPDLIPYITFHAPATKAEKTRKTG